MVGCILHVSTVARDGQKFLRGMGQQRRVRGSQCKKTEISREKDGFTDCQSSGNSRSVKSAVAVAAAYFGGMADRNRGPH